MHVLRGGERWSPRVWHGHTQDPDDPRHLHQSVGTTVPAGQRYALAMPSWCSWRRCQALQTLQHMGTSYTINTLLACGRLMRRQRGSPAVRHATIPGETSPTATGWVRQGADQSQCVQGSSGEDSLLAPGSATDDRVVCTCVEEFFPGCHRPGPQLSLSRLNDKCLQNLEIRYYGISVVSSCFLWGQRPDELKSR